MNNQSDHPLLGISQRLPPANVQAEQALLGALMANNRAYDRVGEFLRDEHFADPIHGRIYGVLAKLVNAGQVADTVTLHKAFENSGVLDEVGGIGYLAQLLGAMVGIINAGDYGRVIHDAWLRRQLIEMGEEMVNRAFAPGDASGTEIMEDVETRLTQIAEGAGDVVPAVQAGQAVKAALEASYTAGKRADSLAGLDTGYAALNRMMGGWMAGDVHIIAARPAMGKSGLALGVAARAASLGHHVLLWSGEMSSVQLGTRLAAAHAGLDVQNVFRGKSWQLPDGVNPGAAKILRELTPHEWDWLTKAERDAATLPLYFDDRSGVTVAQLRMRARRLKRAGKLHLIVIDYVGLMRASKMLLQRGLYEQVTEISRDIKALAMELQVPVVLLSQLSRANERRENKLPQLSDLRETGALEQDASVVIFPHRPHYYLMQEGEPVRGAKEKIEDFDERTERWHAQVAQTEGLAMFSLAKNRNGPTGMTRMKFDARTIWFRDESEGDASPAWGQKWLGGM